MQVLAPTSLEDACAAMRAAGSPPTPIAGATDLLVHWPGNLPAHDKTYLDLTRLQSLRGLRWTSTHLELGALATYWDVIIDARCNRDLPLLVKAARTVGAIQIQARGTWAGNIVNASPAADGVPALMACDASVVLVSGGGGSLAREEVRLDQFYLGYKQMRKRPEQLVESVRVPIRSYDVNIFEKVGARRAQAITKVGVAIAHSTAGWRIVANSVAPTVRRCRAAEGLLDSGAAITKPTDFAAALAKDIAPIDDIRSTAKYRGQVLARVIYFALKGVAPSVR
jgi:CO/xanthine dehydrogenase FAD-binding subunit